MMAKRKTFIARVQLVASFAALAVSAASLVCTAARAASDWRDKDPQSWDQKDVQKILSDSPWSKQLSLGMAADGSLSQSAPPAISAPGSDSSNTGSGGAKMGASAAPGPRDNGPTGASGGFTPLAKFNVRWSSSRTIRQALFREKELVGAPLDQVRKDLDAKYDAYRISITGPDLRAFVKEGEANLKAHSYLTLKSTKQVIAPSNIIMQTRGDGTLIAVLFEFPRKSATGESSIAPNEKSVEFAAKVGNLPLKVSFDVAKMSTKEGADL